jgi:hypothetical protein
MKAFIKLSIKTCEFPFVYGYHFSLMKSGVKIKPIKIKIENATN